LHDSKSQKPQATTGLVPWIFSQQMLQSMVLCFALLCSSLRFSKLELLN
jgi:hypothetical protein